MTLAVSLWVGQGVTPHPRGAPGVSHSTSDTPSPICSAQGVSRDISKATQRNP